MDYISDKNELSRYMSDYLENYDFSCYTITLDNAIEIVTDEMLDYIREKYDFKWGNEFPNFESDLEGQGVVNSALKDYEAQI